MPKPYLRPSAGAGKIRWLIDTSPSAEFRKMWAEFEWENKVSVSTNITDMRAYLDHILGSTNMKCLTPPQALSGSRESGN